MNLQVPPELEAKLTRLAAETGRTVDQVAVDLLTTSMDHEEWFRTEVKKGRIAAREGRLLDR
jgi:predicted transcriptional regulator